MGVRAHWCMRRACVVPRLPVRGPQGDVMSPLGASPEAIETQPRSAGHGSASERRSRGDYQEPHMQCGDKRLSLAMSFGEAILWYHNIACPKLHICYSVSPHAARGVPDNPRGSAAPSREVGATSGCDMANAPRCIACDITSREAAICGKPHIEPAGRRYGEK